MKDLSTAVQFRNRCRETDELMKKTAEEECGEPADVKQEVRIDGEKIKDEPSDDFVDLFENIDTILEEHGAGEESNAFAGIACNAKKEGSTAENSNSDSNEDFHERKPKLKHLRKKSVEFEAK
jgi:hypothetical protein